MRTLGNPDQLHRYQHDERDWHVPKPITEQWLAGLLGYEDEQAATELLHLHQHAERGQHQVTSQWVEAS